VPCRYTSGASPDFEYLKEEITAFLVCEPTWRGTNTPNAVTISRDYQQREFDTLLRAMSQPDRLDTFGCSTFILIEVPIVYAHTDSGWWRVREPIQGCWPNYQLLRKLIETPQGFD
jgi:hypothetical protein